MPKERRFGSTPHKHELLKDIHETLQIQFSLLYDKAYQEGQTVYHDEMQAHKSRCPICGSQEDARK